MPPRESLLLLARESSTLLESSAGALAVRDGIEVIIATGFPLPAVLRVEWERRGYRLIEAKGASEGDLCAAGMGVAGGHVVRVRELTEVLVARGAATERREVVRPG